MKIKGMTLGFAVMLASQSSFAVPPECSEQYQRAGAIPGTSSCPWTAAASSGGMGTFYCTGNSGLTYIPEYCGNLDEDRCNGSTSQSSSTFGNPINIATGHKLEAEADYRDHDWNEVNFPLELVRYYNSNTNVQGGIFGESWRSTFDRNIRLSRSATTAFVVRDAGGQITFNLVSGQWQGAAYTQEKLVRLTDSSGTPTGWRLTLQDNSVETYDSTGRLVSIANKNGALWTLSYQSNQLYRVTDQSGRFIEFHYNAQNLVSEVVDPAGQVYQYEYEQFTFGNDTNRRRLVAVSYPDETPNDQNDNPRREYRYAESTYMDVAAAELKNYSNRLTGIIDENEERYASFGYDSRGRANLSVHGTHNEDATSGEKLNADRLDVTYTVSTNTNTGATSWVASSTNAKEKQTNYTFRQFGSLRFLANATKTPSQNCAGANSGYTYDANGFKDRVTDWNGNVTDYDFDAQGFERKRTEALGLPEQRTIETDWDTTTRLPTEIRKPGLTTTFTYENGRLRTRTERDTTSHTLPYSTAGTVRTWTYSYTYHDSANTQVRRVRVDGPRTDVQDITTYEYDTRGWLVSTTNARNQVYQVLDYNGRGQPLRIRDENGVEISFTYYPRGWLKTRTIESSEGDSTTTYRYDARGLLVGVDKPTGVTLSMGYDSAQRLTSVQNNAGERVEYELDALGNTEMERAIGNSSQIRKQVQSEFDELGRLWKKFAQEGHVLYEYGYDNNGNRTTERDVNSLNLIQQFDAFNRLKLIQQRNNGEVSYTYDAMGNLETVTDQRSHVTRYVYNGFGNRIYEVSPDTGATTYRYDLAGNKTQSVDARNIRTNYTYDALNRLQTLRVEGHASNDVTYTYDQAGTSSEPNFGVGRLTGISQASGITTEFRYDDRSNLIRKSETVDGQNYITQYRYTLGNVLHGVTYPSGRILAYGLDSLARINRISSRENASATEKVIVDNVLYLPFGPVESLRFGNGYVLNKGFDTHYRHDTISTTYGANALLSLDYAYDPSGTIERITDAVYPSESETFDYDSLQQITSGLGVYGQRTFEYDDTGNREVATGQLGAQSWTETYTTNADNNRLTSIVRTGTEASTRSYGYTNDGNIQSEGNRRFVYDGLDRLSEVIDGSTTVARYKHNAFGQRVIKSLPATSDGGRHFQYDQSGQLLAEFTIGGQPRRDYVYLGGTLLAMIDQETGNVSYTDIRVELVGNNGKFDAATSQTSYYARVTNGSAVPANDVTLTLTYPADAALVRIQPSQGSCTADGIRCNLGTIAPNAQVRVDVTVSLPNKGNRDFVVSGETSTSEAVTNNNRATGKFGGSLGIVGLAGLALLTLRRNSVSLKPKLNEFYSRRLKTILVAVIAALYAVIAPVVSAEEIYYIHNDHLNTPKVVTSETRQVVWRGRYSPFGEVEEVVSQVENNVRFPGQYFDSETGLHYNNFRDYDPVTGRYIESDPIGLDGGYNLYAYAFNDPLQYIDFWGLSGSGGGWVPIDPVTGKPLPTPPPGIPGQPVPGKPPDMKPIPGKPGTGCRGAFDICRSYCVTKCPVGPYGAGKLLCLAGCWSIYLACQAADEGGAL